MKDSKITSIEGERKKQLIKIGLILVAMFTILFFLVKFTDDKKGATRKTKNVIAEKVRKGNFSGTVIETEKDVWIARSEEKLKTLEDQNRMIKQNLRELTDIIKNQNNIRSKSTIFPTSQPHNNLLVTKPVENNKPFKVKPLPGIKKFSFGSNSLEISKTIAKKTSFNLPTGKTEDKKPVSKEEEPEETFYKNKDNWLPSGSFMSGILLSGLDAPTGGQAQSNPHPVLIKITNNAFLPNRFRTKIKECFITAGGYGDISSERAYIRTESLSCVLKDGNIIDTPLKGYIAGEDGKNGMRGRLVSKEGQLLARGMMAGFASGVSDAFKTSASTVSVSPLGAIQTIDPERMLESGAYSGAGKAMERLANYYINMAEKVFPIIEIDSGRKIDVVLLKGLSLELEKI